MSLTPATRLDVYEVTTKLGEGRRGAAMRMNLNAVAVVGACIVTLILLGVMIFGSSILLGPPA